MPMPGPKVRVHSPLQRRMQAANENPIRNDEPGSYAAALRAAIDPRPARARAAGDEPAVPGSDLESELMNELQSSFDSIRRPFEPHHIEPQIQVALDDPYSGYAQTGDPSFLGAHAHLHQAREDHFADDPFSTIDDIDAGPPVPPASPRLPQVGEWVLPNTAELPEAPDLPAPDQFGLDDFAWQDEATAPVAARPALHPHFQPARVGQARGHDVMAFGRGEAPPADDDGFFQSDEASDPDEGYAMPLGRGFQAQERRAARRSGRATLVMGMVLGLAVVGGAAALVLSRSDGLAMTASGPPPLITADIGPTKIVPVATADANKIILDPIAANRDVVVARSTEPVTALPQTTVDPASNDALAQIIQPNGTGPTPAQAANAPLPGSPITARTVRTVVFSPNGTILDSGTVPSPSESAAARLAAAAVPSATQLPARPVEVSPMTTASIPAPAASAAAPVQAAPPVAPVQVAALTPTAGRIIVTPGQPGYVVSLVSHRTEAQAVAAFAEMQRRMPTLLGNREASIVPATVADRGVFYRVRVGPVAATQNEAQGLCNQLKAAGQDCFVVPN